MYTPPADSLIVLGQTSKKFLVVPEINDLLAKVGKQEKGAFLSFYRFPPLGRPRLTFCFL